MESGHITLSQKNSGNRSRTFANNEIANNSSISCCKIMMHLIFSKASTRTSCNIMTWKGNDGQVGNFSTPATGYILCAETGSDFVLPILYPGLPKNGG